MKILGFEQGPRLPGDLYRPTSSGAVDPGNVQFVGSGKAAIALILDFLRSNGTLDNKMTRVFMPQWLGTWVYAQVLDYAFPTTQLDPACRVAICYHQYGFPQNMDKVLSIATDRKMTLIEDCAHAVASSYRGTPLGQIGDFALFSYSKFAFCYALGGVAAKDRDFAAHMEARLAQASRLLCGLVNGFKFLDERNLSCATPRWPRLFDGGRKMIYARYGDQLLGSPRAVALWLAKRDAEIAARIENYRDLRREFARFGLCDKLESDGVAPYAVPLNISGSAAANIIADLRKEHVSAGTYRFDVARCVFEPDFRSVVLVPIHSGMRGRGMDLLVSTVKKHLM
jgi:hypothetical protein